MIQVGKLFCDRYEVLSKLGEGGMGAVYKVLDTELNTVCALKVLNPDLTGSKENKDRFLREGQSMSRISHENVARIFRLGMDGAPYIVMEYLEGKSLRELLQEQEKLSRNLALDLVTQICDGMLAAHEKNVLHRDLKPDNIIVVPHPDAEKFLVKIVDFGLARFKSVETTKGQHLTQTGAVLGSVHYMSPEQCIGAKLDERSDVYSLGCVLFECLTGHPPFQAESAISMLHMHRHEDIPQLPKTDDSDGGVSGVISKALAKKPEDRYQSMQEFRDDLCDCMNGVTPRGAIKARTRGRTVGKVPILILLSLLLIVGTVFFLKVFLWDSEKNSRLVLTNRPTAKVLTPASVEAEVSRAERKFRLTPEHYKPDAARVVLKTLANLREGCWEGRLFESWYALTPLIAEVSSYTPNGKTRQIALYCENYYRCYEIFRAGLDESRRNVWLEREKSSLKHLDDVISSFNDFDASINGAVAHSIDCIRRGDFAKARKIGDPTLQRLQQKPRSIAAAFFPEDIGAAWVADTTTEWLRHLTEFDYCKSQLDALDFTELVANLTNSLEPGERGDRYFRSREFARKTLASFFPVPPTSSQLRKRYDKVCRELCDTGKSQDTGKSPSTYAN